MACSLAKAPSASSASPWGSCASAVLSLMAGDTGVGGKKELVSVFQPGVVAAMVARGGFCVCGRSQGMGGAGAEEVVLDGALGEGGSVWAVGYVTKTWGCSSFSMDT